MNFELRELSPGNLYSGDAGSRIMDALPSSYSISIWKSLISESFMGMDSALFVSRYEVELPKKDEMAAFLDRTIAELGGGDV